MGKKIDELKGLDDRPIESPDPRDVSKPWAAFLQEIDDLLASGSYTWAEDSLKGIYDTVEKKQWVTDGQKKAVQNIKEGVARRRFGRRYEGWR